MGCECDTCWYYDYDEEYEEYEEYEDYGDSDFEDDEYNDSDEYDDDDDLRRDFGDFFGKRYGYWNPKRGF